MSTSGQTNQLLGYPSDARLLIINADDFGMCHAVNAAVIGALQEGIVRSTTLMVPCPWMLQALHFLQGHPEVSFGVHLTVISEWVEYRWGPVTPREKIPSLIGPAGYFYNFEQMPAFLAQVRLDELEMEFRSQIEFVLAAGLHPTHLDWHALRIDNSEDIFELMLDLAREYGLALRVAGRARIEKVQSQGLPCNDHDFLDSYGLDSLNKADIFDKLLRDLPPGLSEWAVHPGIDCAELFAIEPDPQHIRQTDFDFVTSRQMKEIIAEEGIVLLDYQALQETWTGRAGSRIRT
jgi:predicted glycoside hydrolase/deacetylase ChbG (UPF0249 family)